MIIASYRNAMRNAVPVYDPEAPDELYRLRRERKSAAARQITKKEDAEKRALAIVTEEQKRAAFRAAMEKAMAKYGEVEQSLPKRIIAETEKRHGLPKGSILSKSRQRSHVEARHDAIAEVYERGKVGGARYSLPEMGRIFGGRDHTTILHALRQRGLK